MKKIFSDRSNSLWTLLRENDAMTIPHRHTDKRASAESSVLCDIALDRMAHERQQEPIESIEDGVLFYQFGEEKFHLRVRANRSMRSLFWTNISRQQIKKVIASGAQYLGITYSEGNHSELLLFFLDPQFLLTVFDKLGFPTNEAKEWSFRCRTAQGGPGRHGTTPV